MKIWLKYFLYMLAIFILAFVQYYLTRLAGMTFNSLFNLGAMTINTLVGALLGAETLALEFKKEGYWKVNFPKLALLALPSLVLGFASFLLFTSFSLMLYVPRFVFSSMGIFQLILGYSVTTSFYKVEQRENVI